MWLLLVLMACRTEEDAPASDLDGDGVSAPDDCDDADADVRPGAAETGDGRDRDCDGRTPPAPAELAGGEPDEGFGHAVLIIGGRVVIGAPFAQPSAGALPSGRVTVGDASSWPGAFGAARGAALAALSDGTVLVGEPGAGAVRTPEGALVFAEAGAGGALAAREAAWAVRTADGAARSDGVRVAAGRPADALAWLSDGRLAVGLGTGDVALLVGDARVLRATPSDGAGRVLAVGDVDGDGADELLIGAPEAGRVYVLDPGALPASLSDAPYVTGPAAGGRFGAAIAVHEAGDWFVGAPVDGAEAEGAVYRIRGSAVEPFRAGTAAGEQLGFALSAADDALLIGAPGAAGTPGAAVLVVP